MSNLPPLDAEETMVSWLNTILPDGWVAAGDKPDPLTEAFVTVDRTQGARESMVLDMAEILVEFYHKTDRKAAKDVGLAVADQITDMLMLNDNLTHAKVNSFVHLDDTLNSYHRYNLYVELYARR